MRTLVNRIFHNDPVIIPGVVARIRAYTHPNAR